VIHAPKEKGSASARGNERTRKQEWSVFLLFSEEGWERSWKSTVHTQCKEDDNEVREERKILPFCARVRDREGRKMQG